MKTLFADTFYWAALINPRDSWHDLVRQTSQSLAQDKLVTTEEVLTELLNFFSSYQAVTRQGIVSFVISIINDLKIEVVRCSHKSFRAGLALYAQRLDKEYSLTDCISMQTMRQQEITEILTHDKHFTQEGFTILFP